MLHGNVGLFYYMKLVNYNNYMLEFEPELLLLKPFKHLHDKDTSETKENFLKFLSILYFTYDPRSEFNYIVEEDTRLEEVCSANGWKVPVFGKTHKQCIELYQKMTTTSSLQLLQNTRIAADKVGQFLRDIDMAAEDDKGKPKYQIAQVVSAIDKVPQIVQKLSETEQLVAKEIQEQSRARGTMEGSIMDNGLL